MRNGSRIPVGIAILLLIAGVIDALANVGRLVADNQAQADWPQFASQLLGTSAP